MREREALDALSALSQETRLRILRLLVRSHDAGLASGAIAEAVGVSASNISFHLSLLERAGLLESRREGRSILYRARVAAIADLARFLFDDCCGGRPEACAPVRDALARPASAPPAAALPRERVFDVLFLCTGNSARSIMAEAILAREGAGRFRAFSAGSHPRGEVDPMALRVLEALDYPTQGLRSKHWSEFARLDAPRLDFVFTVCDAAAGESCPAWLGRPVSAHWGIEDPAAATGEPFERERAFARAFRYLRNRITAFVALPVARLDALSLRRDLDEIGRSEGASRGAVVPFPRAPA